MGFDLYLWGQNIFTRGKCQHSSFQLRPDGMFFYFPYPNAVLFHWKVLAFRTIVHYACCICRTFINLSLFYTVISKCS